MTIHLWPHQAELASNIYARWARGDQNVLAVLATGGGKTRIFADILRNHNGASCAIAHRSELVTQMSLALAECEVRHRIIGPNSLIKSIVHEQMRELGKCWFDPNAQCAVAGVNTIINRKEQLKHWSQQVTLWVQDESHHLLADPQNTWGEAVTMFPNARGLGVTATPTRADGYGLGRHANGVFDSLVEGPPMRWLIEQGYLTDYIVSCPPNDIQLARVPVSESTGDYSQPKLKKAVRESHIVGDVVEHYLKRGRGKLGLVFSTDIETASDINQKFNAASVRAEVLTGKTQENIRIEAIHRFRNREIMVLVTVDLVSEGFNLPAIEVVMFARPTASIGLRDQQWGRGLRPIWPKGFDVGVSTQTTRLAAIASSVKPFAIIHDHVGNALRPGFGLPDRPRVWTLDARDKRKSNVADDAIPLRACVSCTRPYERFRIACPYCGHVPVPAGRSRPEFVDGDLHELSAEALAAMRQAIDHVDGSSNIAALRLQASGAHPAAVQGLLKQHGLRQDAQGALREAISWWAGWQHREGLSDRESHKRFFLTFGIDVMTAQALGRPEAMELASRVNRHLGAHSNG